MSLATGTISQLLRGDSYFKLRERQAIISRQFARAMRELHSKSMYKNYLALSDSCGAATLF